MREPPCRSEALPGSFRLSYSSDPVRRDKTIGDFATSLVSGSLTFAIAELAGLPTAAVAVEGTYSSLLRYAYTRGGLIPELIARLLIRYPNVSINFLESRKVAEEWTYRYLTAAYANADTLQLQR